MSQYRTALIVAAGLIFLSAMHWPSEVTTVILVRHAEKSPKPSGDPDLTAIGKERSETLLHVLSDAEVDIIISSQYRRTGETIAPLAAHLNLKPIIIRGLGVSGVSDMDESHYSNLFVVRLESTFFSTEAEMVNLKYGNPTGD